MFYFDKKTSVNIVYQCIVTCDDLEMEHISLFIVFDFLFVCQLQYFEATRKTIIIDV